MNTESKVAGIILGGIAVALILIPVLGSQTTIFLTNGSGNGGPVSCLPNGELVLAQNLTDLCDVTIISPITNQIVQYNGTQWINQNLTAVLPDSTVCGNVGAGVILCKGGNVQIKSLIAQSGIQITNDTNTVYISNTGVLSISPGSGISVNQTTGHVLVSATGSSENTTCNDVGSGEGTLCAGDNVNIKSLKQGSNIQLTNNPTNVTIAVTGITSEDTACNNLGTGTILCAGNNVNIKTLKVGTGLSIANTSNDVTFTNTSPESTSCGNLGTGTKIHDTTTNCSAKSLIGGTGVLITNTANNITISSSASNESTVCTNDGHGAGNVCNGGNVHLKGIASGASVSITMNGTDIIITNSAPESTVCTSAGGTTLIKSSSGGNCDFKGLTTSQGITVTSNTNDNNIKTNFANGTGIQITGATTQTFTNTLPENTVCTNKGSFGSDGHGICFDSAVTLRRLLAGSGITISNSTNSITLTNASPENTVCTNASTWTLNGEGLCIDNSVQLRRILTGSGISRSNTTNAVLLTNTGVISNSCSGGITCSGTNPSTFTVTWELLKQCSLSSANVTLVCGGFTARKHLTVVFESIIVTNTYEIGWQFNTDTGNNYAIRTSINGGADATTASTGACRPLAAGTTIAVANGVQSTFFIDNNSTTQRKIVYGTWGAGIDTSVATAPTRGEFACKWGNTSAQITTITTQRVTGTGSLGSGTRMSVWGHD